MVKPCFSSLRDFFEKGYDSGAIFQNEEYTFSEDAWGYLHKRTGITVWADPLDLREEDQDGEGEVFFHFTSPLGYHNITNESKEKVEVWASLITEGEGANAYWGQGVYTVPKPPDEWRDREQILDNNYRSMMKRDLENKGKDYVEREYPPRVAFCIPIICHPDMAYDVSVRQTPEMERKGKPPGENLAGILLNPPGMPLRTCVVVIRHANDVAELPRQRSSKRLSQRKLHASGNLLERVKLRARAVAQQHGTGSKEAMGTEFRKAVVLAESGRYKEALHVMIGELMRRRLILGKSDIATVRATWRFSQILINLGHFRDAQDCLLDVLRNLPRLSLSSGKGLSPEQLQSFEREHLRSLLSLGEIFKVQHKMKYAEPIFLEAYVGCRESLGPTHFDTLSSLQDLAAVSVSLRKHQQAEDYYNEAQKELSQQLGKTHPACLKCQLDLAETMGLHRKYDDSVKLYETALGNIQKQLGSQHPKTKATNAAYIRVLCEDLKIKKALRAWLQQVQVDGVMNQLPLLLMIFYHFSKAFGLLGIVILSFLGMFSYPAAWLLIEKAAREDAGHAFNHPWLLCFAPLWLISTIMVLLVLPIAFKPGKKSDTEGETSRSRQTDPSDLVYLQILAALMSSSLLWALERDGYFQTSPPVLMSPWLLLEVHWLQCQCWAWLRGRLRPWNLAEGLVLGTLRAWSALYFVGWPTEAFGPWTVLFCPTLLIAFFYLYRILRHGVAKNTATPLSFAIEVSLSPELRWALGRLLMALLSSILLMNYSSHAPAQASAYLTTVPLLALGSAPALALLLLRLQTTWRMLKLKHRREGSWEKKWLVRRLVKTAK